MPRSFSSFGPHASRSRCSTGGADFCVIPISLASCNEEMPLSRASFAISARGETTPGREGRWNGGSNEKDALEAGRVPRTISAEHPTRYCQTVPGEPLRQHRSGPGQPTRHRSFLFFRRLQWYYPRAGGRLQDSVDFAAVRSLSRLRYGVAATKSRPRCRRNCGLNTTVSNNTENRRSARRFFCISCNNGSSDNTTDRPRA